MWSFLQLLCFILLVSETIAWVRQSPLFLPRGGDSSLNPSTTLEASSNATTEIKCFGGPDYLNSFDKRAPKRNKSFVWVALTFTCSEPHTSPRTRPRMYNFFWITYTRTVYLWSSAMHAYHCWKVRTKQPIQTRAFWKRFESRNNHRVVADFRHCPQSY